MTARAGVIGVTSVRSNTDFKVNRSSAVASLQLVDGVPVTATTVSVRFKKGDDVWELRVDPTAGNIIDLTVPNGETDRFPGATVDWVLFTLIDADGYVVGVGGGAL